MGSKSPTQTTTTNTPPPQVLAQYQAATTKANAAAAQPYTPYGGELVAPVNQQQNTGIGNVNTYANAAQPALAGAAGLTLAGAGPANAQQFSSGALNQYMSPYTQDVVNATQAAFQNQNTQQAQQLEGNAIGAGAFGGDRAGVAQGILAGQQQTAEAPVIAGLENQNYAQALGEFNTQQQTNLSAQQANLARLGSAGLQLGNIGTAAQTAGLQGAGAQLQAGTLQQQTQQSADTAAYNQFLQQQAYPFQTAQFQANIAEGIGSNSGGTSTSTTSAPNSAAPYIGAGLGLLALSARGGRIWPKYASGGLVIDARHRFAGGGGVGGLVIPYASNEQNVQSWVPQTSPQMGRGMGIPNAVNPSNSNQQNQNLQAMTSIGKGVAGLGNSSIGNTISDFAQDTFGFANGGLVLRPGYDDGGIAPSGGLAGLSPSDISALQAAFLAAPPQQSPGAIDPSITARAIAEQPGKLQNRVLPETQYPLPPASSAPPGLSSVAAPGTLAAYRDSILNSQASAPTMAASAPPAPAPAPGLAYSSNGAATPVSSAYVPHETQPAPFAGIAPSAGLTGVAPPPPSPTTDASSPQQNNAGLFGLHLSDPVRAGLLSAAFGVMASPSRNLAMAIGQGGQQGVATYEKALDQAREQMLTKAQISNYNSEVANRPLELAVKSRQLDIMAAQAGAAIDLQHAQLPGVQAESNVKVAQGAMQTEVMNNYLRQHGQQPITGASNPAPTGNPANPSVTSAGTPPVIAATAPAARTAPTGPGGPASSGAPPAGGQFPPGRSPADVDPRDDPMALRATADQYSMVPTLTDQANRLYAQAAAVMTGQQQVRYVDGAGNITGTDYYPGVGQAKSQQAAQTASAETAARLAVSAPIEQKQKIASQDIEKAHGDADAAQQALYRLQEMNEQVKNLPTKGFLVPGAFAGERANFARGLNTVAQGFGGQPLVDPNNVAALEELGKDKFRLGAELSRTIGGREPGFIVQNAVTANPGAENSAVGYKRIVAGLTQSMMYKNDYANFIPQYYADHGETLTAPAEFQKTHPTSGYVERAIASTVDPRDAAAIKPHINDPGAVSVFDRKYGAGSAAILAKRNFDTSNGLQ